MRRQIFSHLASQFSLAKKLENVWGVAWHPPEPRENGKRFNYANLRDAMLIRKSARGKSPARVEAALCWCQKGPPGINQYANGELRGQGSPPEANEFGKPPIRRWKLIGNASRLAQMLLEMVVELKFEFGSGLWAWTSLAIVTFYEQIFYTFAHFFSSIFCLTFVKCRKKFFTRFSLSSVSHRLYVKGVSLKKV